MDDGTPTTQMRFSDSGGIYRRIEYNMACKIFPSVVFYMNIKGIAL